MLGSFSTCSRHRVHVGDEPTVCRSMSPQEDQNIIFSIHVSDKLEFKRLTKTKAYMIPKDGISFTKIKVLRLFLLDSHKDCSASSMGDRVQPGRTKLREAGTKISYN